MTLKSLGKNVTELTLKNGNTVLVSYSTPVAVHIPGDGYYKTTESYSRTTTRHINDFLKRNGGSKFKGAMTPADLNSLVDPS